jgi:hypothetical protein
MFKKNKTMLIVISDCWKRIKEKGGRARGVV